MDAVAESIKQFGFKIPIIIDGNDEIIAGHTRVKAAKKLGIEEVPTILADDLTPEQARAFRLVDNKVAEIAEWDMNILAVELDSLGNIDMSEFGFSDDGILAEDFGDEFALPDGDKTEICQMTFTLHEKQKELIEYAIKVCENDISETFGNSNKNGNALYEVIRQWAGRRK